MNEMPPVSRARAAIAQRSAARRVGRLLLTGIIAATLSGCLMGPNYKRPNVPLPKTWRSPAGGAAKVVDTAWWKDFHDPDLDALITRAIDANKDLLEATARVQEYQAQLKIAGADEYPQFGYQSSAGRRHYSTERPESAGILQQPNQNDFQVGVNAHWELDLWGKVRRANEAARADLLASEYARRGVMLTVVTNVATAYFKLLALDRQLVLARQELKARGEALNLVTTRYRGGSSSKLAVLQARSAVDEVWVKIPDLQHQISEQENALSLLVGKNPGDVVRLASDNEPALPPVPAGVPSDILSQRPDVLEAEQDLVAANAKIGVAKAEFFPSISLTGLFGVASNALDTLLDHQAIDRSISAGLLGPIFEGGRLTGNLHLAEAQERELLVKYQQAVQTALGDVDDALVFNAKAKEIAQRGEQQVDTLRHLLNLAEISYQGGQIDYLGVLTAEQDLYNVETAQVDRHRDEYLALVSVYTAMGGGWMKAQDERATAAAAAAKKITRAHPGAARAASQPQGSARHADDAIATVPATTSPAPAVKPPVTTSQERPR